MIINRHEAAPSTSLAPARPQLNNELATSIALVKTKPGVSVELWKTANTVLAAVNVPNPSSEVAKDAQDVLYHLNQAAARYKSPEQNVTYDGISKEAPREVLSDNARAAVIAASIAAAKENTGVLPVDETGPVAPPLQDAETLVALVRQPGAIGAAAVHDTLHPGSHN